MRKMFFTLLYTLDSHAIILGDVFYLNRESDLKSQTWQAKEVKLEEGSKKKLVDRYCL